MHSQSSSQSAETIASAVTFKPFAACSCVTLLKMSADYSIRMNGKSDVNTCTFGSKNMVNMFAIQFRCFVVSSLLNIAYSFYHNGAIKCMD